MIDHRKPHRFHGFILAGTVICLAACSRAAPEATAAPDVSTGPATAELSAAACIEARGELAELASVTGGMRPFASATLRTQYLEELAVASNAPAVVQTDLVQWKTHVDARLQALRDLPPRYESGRLLEPDVAPLDRRFIADMQPVGERLGDWVARTCAAQGSARDASAARAVVQSAQFPG